MKKISTLLPLLIVFSSVFAFPDQQKLTISSAANFSVTVIIDGRTLQAKHDGTYTINNLTPGSHTVTIYKQGANSGRRNRQKQVIYNANLYVKRGYHTDITINRFGKAFIDEQLIGTDYDQEYGENQPYVSAMDNRSFEQLKQVINNERFDDTKIRIAKQAVSMNNFNSVQAKQLVQLFSFEANKVDIAKFLYRYTIDKQNYTIIYDALTYSSSKEELYKYIQQYR